MIKRQSVIVIILLISVLLSGCQHLSVKPQNNNSPSLATVELPYTDCYSISKANDRIIACVKNKSNGNANEIVSYNIKNTKDIKILYKSQFNDSNILGLSSNNKWLVWVDTNTLSNRGKIIAQNLVTGTTKTISETNSDYAFIMAPSL